MQDSPIYEEQTITRQTLKNLNDRPPKSFPNASSFDEKRQTQLPPTTNFLYTSITSCAAWLFQFVFFWRSGNQRDTVSSSTPSSAPERDSAQKSKLQTLMDRRRTEAERAYYNRKVIVTFCDHAEFGFSTNAEKRKRDEVSEDEDCLEPTYVSSFLPLDDEHFAGRRSPLPASSSPPMSYNICMTSRMTSAPPCPAFSPRWERPSIKRHTSTSFDDDDSSVFSPDELENASQSQSFSSGGLTEEETDMELEFSSEGDSSSDYSPPSSPSVEPTRPPIETADSEDSRMSFEELISGTKCRT